VQKKKKKERREKKGAIFPVPTFFTQSSLEDGTCCNYTTGGRDASGVSVHLRFICLREKIGKKTTTKNSGSLGEMAHQTSRYCSSLGSSVTRNKFIYCHNVWTNGARSYCGGGSTNRPSTCWQ
jgi:hypothetical protein